MKDEHDDENLAVGDVHVDNLVHVALSLFTWVCFQLTAIFAV